MKTGQVIFRNIIPGLDLFNGKIITYTIGHRPTYSPVSRKYYKKCKRNIKLLMHSDQGQHYQMKQYRHALESRRIVQSMSRRKTVDGKIENESVQTELILNKLPKEITVSNF